MKMRLAPSRAFDVVGPRSLSPAVWLLGAVGPQAFDSLLGKFGYDLLALVALCGVALVSAILILIPGWLILPRVTSTVGKRLLIWASYLASAIASASLVVAVFSQTDRVPQSPVVQIISGALFFPWCLLVASMYVNDRFRFRRTLATQSATRSRLDAMSQWRQTELESMRLGMLDRIREQLVGARDALGKTAADQAALTGLTDRTIRPLMNDIDAFTFDERAELATLPDRVARRRSARAVFDATFAGSSDALVPIALFMATGWLGTGLTLGNWVALPILVLLGGAVPLVTLWLSTRCLITPLRVVTRLWIRIPIIVLLWIISIALGQVPAVLVAGIPLPVAVSIAVPTTIVLFVFNLVVARSRVGIDLTTEIQRDNEAIEHRLTENALHTRALRESLRRFIHADMQSVFMAIERQATSKNNGKTMKLLEELIASVTSLNDQMSQMTSPELGHTVSELGVIWEGVLDISFTSTAEVESVLEESVLTSSALSEILIEAVTNAVKHSAAQGITISLSLAQPLVVSLTVASRSSAARDGAATNTETGTARRSQNEAQRNGARQTIGHGTRLFDEVCLSWELSTVGKTSQFHAMVPVLGLGSDTTE